ncbi:hypothetical protein MIMGU_mgv1a0124282mg, partial [Erythranthe guttata]
MLQLVKYTK